MAADLPIPGGRRATRLRSRAVPRAASTGTGAGLVVLAVLLTAGCGAGPGAAGPATTTDPSTVADTASPQPTRYDLVLRGVLDVVDPAPAGACPAPVPDPTDSDPDGEVTLCGQGPGTRVQYRLGPARVTGDMVTSAEAIDEMGTAMVGVSLDAAGTTALAELTGQLMAKPAPTNQVAVVIGGAVTNAPTVASRIETGRVELAGFDTITDARTVVDTITSGRLRGPQ